MVFDWERGGPKGRSHLELVRSHLGLVRGGTSGFGGVSGLGARLGAGRAGNFGYYMIPKNQV